MLNEMKVGGVVLGALEGARSATGSAPSAAAEVKRWSAGRKKQVVLRKITLAMLRLDTAYPKSSLRQRRNRASRKPLYRAELLGLRPRSQTSTTKSIQ